MSSAKYKLLKNKRRMEVEVQPQDKSLPLSEQFELLSRFELNRAVVKAAESMGMSEPGVRDTTYQFYNADDKLVDSRSDPSIRYIGRLYRFDSVRV